MTQSPDHWNDVYASKSTDALTWHQDAPSETLEVIRGLIQPGQAIIDVGGGTSSLAGALVAAGLGPVRVLDLSQQAISHAQEQLGAAADSVDWVVADVTKWAPDRAYSFWHDRAVFHFLTEHSDRKAYVEVMLATLEPEGFAMISTFADDGPEKCSGLPVQRYSPDGLSQEVNKLSHGAFETVSARRHDHVTPTGNIQKFQTTLLRRR